MPDKNHKTPIMVANNSKKPKQQKVDVKKYLNNYRLTKKVQVVSFRTEFPWIRSNDRYTHLIHRYPAKLLPHIPAFFLNSAFCPKHATVLDPFAGSGTVLLEAMLYGHNAFGVEINPVARLIAKVKTSVYPTHELEDESEQIRKCHRDLSHYRDLPEFPNRDLWFSPLVQIRLSRLKRAIEESPLKHRDFFWVVFSSLVRKVALADPHVSPPVVIKPYRFPSRSEMRRKAQQMLEDRQYADITELFNNSVQEQLKRFRKLEDEANNELGQGQIVWDDARTLCWAPIAEKGLLVKSKTQKYRDASVDMVITSPPYLSAQKYARSLRLEWYWLGLGPYENHRAMDASMIGSERLLKDEYFELKSVEHPKADRIIQDVYTRDRHRAGMLSKYYQDIRICLQQMYRVLKSGGHLVLVVGNNRVLNHRVPNQQIFRDFAMEEGFRMCLMMVDEISSRGLMTKRNSTADIIPHEWVLVFRK